METIDANVQKVEASLKMWNERMKELNMDPMTIKQHLVITKTEEYLNAYEAQLKEVYSKVEEILQFVKKGYKQVAHTEVHAELPDEIKGTKIYSWDNNSFKVNVYDIVTKKKESFNVNVSFPDSADGIMRKNLIYIMGGSGPNKSTY